MVYLGKCSKKRDGNKFVLRTKLPRIPPPRGVQNPQQNQKIVIFKMQPKIVVVLVLGTPEHLELGLILQNWPSALHFNFCRFYTVKTAKKRQKMEIAQNFTRWCKTLNSKANSSIFGEFWECKSGIGYFISPKVPFLNAQSWALLPKIAKSAQLWAFKNGTFGEMK